MIIKTNASELEIQAKLAYLLGFSTYRIELQDWFSKWGENIDSVNFTVNGQGYNFNFQSETLEFAENYGDRFQK